MQTQVFLKRVDIFMPISARGYSGDQEEEDTNDLVEYLEDIDLQPFSQQSVNDLKTELWSVESKYISAKRKSFSFLGGFIIILAGIAFLGSLLAGILALVLYAFSKNPTSFVALMKELGGFSIIFTLCFFAIMIVRNKLRPKNWQERPVESLKEDDIPRDILEEIYDIRKCVPRAVLYVLMFESHRLLFVKSGRMTLCIHYWN